MKNGKLNKRLAAFLLTLIMLVGILPMGVFAAEPQPKAAPEEFFSDVSADSWYYEYVKFVKEKGYFVGIGDNLFAPEVTMSRAMFVSVMARIDEAKVDNNVSPFSDVPAGQWYSGSVKWASDNGIVVGYGDGTFGPENPITRQEMCLIMDKFIQYYEKKTGKTNKAEGSTEAFPDADQISDWAKKSVETCRKYGLIYGCGDGLFHPLDNSTRSQVASVVAHLSWLVKPDEPYYPPYNPPTPPAKYNYKISYYPNYDDLKPMVVTTTPSTSKLQSFTVAGADKVEREGFVFAGWNTLANGEGVNYEAGKTYDISANLDLYAQWVADDDYIGNAVMAAMREIGTKYADEINNNELNDKAGNPVEIGQVVFSNAISTTVKEDDTRAQRVSAKLSITDDLVNKSIEKAVTVACELLNGTRDPLTREDVESTVQGVVDALPVVGGWEIDIVNDTVKEITDKVYAQLLAEGKGLWENFWDENNNYYCGDVTIKVGDVEATIDVDQTNHTTTLVGSKRETAKKLAAAIAREMYADMTTVTTYTSKLDVSSTVTLTFDDPDNDLSNATKEYPHIYPFEIALTLDGGEYVDYMFNGQSNVRLNITKDLQTTYSADVERLVEAALANTQIQDEMADRVKATVETFEKNSTFGALKNAMTKMGNTDPDTAIGTTMDAWTKANMDVTDLTSGNAYKHYWLDDGTELENKDIYDLIHSIGNDAGVYAEDKLRKEFNDSAEVILRALRTDPQTSTFEGCKKLLSDFGFELDVFDASGDERTALVQDYVLAQAIDYLRRDPEAEWDVTKDGPFATEKRESMVDAIDGLVQGALEGTSYYSYLEKALKVKSIKGMETVALSNIATLLEKGFVQNYLTNKGTGLIPTLKKIIDRLPAGASVEINGAELSAASLEEVKNAEDAADVCTAIAKLIRTPGLEGLSLSSFANGQDITVNYNSRTFTFTLVIDVQ